MKKTLMSLVLGTALFGGSAEAQIISTPIDTNFIYSNPALRVKDGITYEVWSRKNDLMYADSKDNFATKTVIATGTYHFDHPAMDIDSNNIVHVAYNYLGSTFYTNSNGWINQNLGIGNADEQISLAIDRNNKLYIAGQKNNGNDLDISILSSTDYHNFSTTIIPKANEQINPRIAIDSMNNVHLAYFDWSDGVIDGKGQYKTRYRNSIDNFVSEQTISMAPQSYGADIKVDNRDDVWISFQDTSESSQGFMGGNVYVADLMSNWANKTKLTVTSKEWMQDRPTSLAIDNLGNKHVTWSEYNWDVSNSPVYIMYGLENPSLNTSIQVADVGYIGTLGYSVIDVDGNTPIIGANIHSLYNFSIGSSVPEPSTLTLSTIALAGIGFYLWRKR